MIVKRWNHPPLEELVVVVKSFPVELKKNVAVTNDITISFQQHLDPEKSIYINNLNNKLKS